MNIGLEHVDLTLDLTDDTKINKEMQNAIYQLCRDKGVEEWDWIVTRAYLLASQNIARQNPAIASRIFHRYKNQITRIFNIIPRIRQIEARAHCRYMMTKTTQFDTMWEALLA